MRQKWDEDLVIHGTAAKITWKSKKASEVRLLLNNVNKKLVRIYAETVSNLSDEKMN